MNFIFIHYVDKKNYFNALAAAAAATWLANTLWIAIVFGSLFCLFVNKDGFGIWRMLWFKVLNFAPICPPEVDTGKELEADDTGDETMEENMFFHGEVSGAVICEARECGKRFSIGLVEFEFPANFWLDGGLVTVNFNRLEGNCGCWGGLNVEFKFDKAPRTDILFILFNNCNAFWGSL